MWSDVLISRFMKPILVNEGSAFRSVYLFVLLESPTTLTLPLVKSICAPG